MKIIYADFNNIACDGTMWLTCVGSVEAIDALEMPLVVGELVWLSDGELWVKATVMRAEDMTWFAVSDWRFREGPGVDTK